MTKLHRSDSFDRPRKPAAAVFDSILKIMESIKHSLPAQNGMHEYIKS
jgi:hypothetical protein